MIITKNKTKHCIVCGKTFDSKTPWHKYCSRKCSSQIYRENHGLKLKNGRFCRQCGVKFFPELKQQNKQHCSIECSRKSARESRSKFYERNPQKSFEYYKRRQAKHSIDNNMHRFLQRFPNAPRKCQSCGEERVLDIAHKLEHRRNGSWRSNKNTTLDKIWILCPTCHALIDRKGIPPSQLGLE
jgi:predicted nucleic acid-binding Zn ribbon protein